MRVSCVTAEPPRSVVPAIVTFNSGTNAFLRSLLEKGNAELHALYSSTNIIRNLKPTRLKWAGHVARMDLSRNAYRVLVGRPEGKRPLGRPRLKWEYNTKMDLREVGFH